MARDVTDAEILIAIQRLDRRVQALTYALELRGLLDEPKPAVQKPTSELPDDGN